MYFEIHADDTDRAIAFYTRVFGWSFTFADNLSIPYWRVETGGVRAGLLKRPFPRPAPQSGLNAFACSFEVASFDAAAQNILAAGGRTIVPKMAITGICWQGYFLDSEYNVFGIFELDDKA